MTIGAAPGSVPTFQLSKRRSPLKGRDEGDDLDDADRGAAGARKGASLCLLGATGVEDIFALPAALLLICCCCPSFDVAVAGDSGSEFDFGVAGDSGSEFDEDPSKGGGGAARCIVFASGAARALALLALFEG